MKKYTLVKFMFNNEIICKYFEGTPTLMQINNIIGFLPIIEIDKIKGYFPADYVKTNNLYGYTAGN